MREINKIETIEFYFMTKNSTSSINSKENNIPSHNSQQSHKSQFRQNPRHLSEP